MAARADNGCKLNESKLEIFNSNLDLKAFFRCCTNSSGTFLSMLHQQLWNFEPWIVVLVAPTTVTLNLHGLGGTDILHGHLWIRKHHTHTDTHGCTLDQALTRFCSRTLEARIRPLNLASPNAFRRTTFSVAL